MREDNIMSKTPFDKEKTIQIMAEIGTKMGMDVSYPPHVVEEYMDLDLNKNYDEEHYDFLGIWILTEEEALQNPVEINGETYYITIGLDFSMSNVGEPIYYYPFLFKFMKAFIDYNSDFYYSSTAMEHYYTPQDILDGKVGWVREFE